MDTEVLKQQLRQRFEQALEQMIRAVEQAPDGRWIAGSEWQVRQAGQELTRDCYQAILQTRIAQTPAANDAPAFSPSGGGGGSAPAQQGHARRDRAQRRR